MACACVCVCVSVCVCVGVGWHRYKRGHLFEAKRIKSGAADNFLKAFELDPASEK